MQFFRHLHTVCKHRRLVRKNCFKAGLVWQGLTHDLSKFSAKEFWRGVKYYQGDRSPQAKERELFGYSAAWLHHKGRNKHHFEYWTDVNPKGEVVYVEMPAKYLAEMVCDRIAASKVYKGKDYTDSCPLEYFSARKGKAAMNEKTSERLEYFLTLLAERGEKEMFKQLKDFVKVSKKKSI
ncbi:MAG: catalase [Clostridia bacterium]|nr:catalase [Clostridia bacterium]